MTSAAPARPPDPGDPTDARAYPVFTALWAIAVAIEVARMFGPSGSMAVLLALVLARVAGLWVLVRPAAVGRFLLLCAAMALFVFLRMPKLNNHGLVFLFTCLAVWLAWGRLAIARRSLTVAPDELLRTFAPAVRLTVLAMYFWATFHKLNADFFALDLSCGTWQLHNVHAALPLLPTTLPLQYFAIYGTLLVEGAIPLLLWFRRTRSFGIALAVGFHYVLGASYPGFSAMLYAMLVLFAPPGFFDRLWALGRALADRAPAAARRLARVRPSLDAALRTLALALAAFTLFALVFAPSGAIARMGPPWLSREAVTGLWLVYGVGCMVVLARCIWGPPLWSPAPGRAFRMRYGSLAVIPLAAFANGLSPHVGLKNTLSYAMFSNLRTEDGFTNHLVIPGSWQVFDYQRDLVTIHSSSDPVLQKLVGPSWRTFNYFSTYVVGVRTIAYRYDPPSWRLPYFALRRRISELAAEGVTDIEVDFERNGERRRLRQAERDPELSRVPYWLNKFLFLRAVPEGRRGYCLW